VAIALSALLLVSAVGFAQVTVSLPTVTAKSGATQQIPITVGDLTGKGVISFQFTVTFDPAIINITGITAAGTLASSLQVSAPNTSVAGQISVAAAGLAALSNGGTLIYLNATMVGKGTSALHFSAFSFNEGNPAATLVDGSAVVPALSASVTNTTLVGALGSAITVPIATEDVTGKGVISYQFTVKFDPTKINLTGVSTTGTLSQGMTLSPVNTSVAGQISVAAAGLAPLSSSGVLINLTGTVVAYGTSAVQFSTLQYNEGNPAVGGVDGTVTVSSSTNRAPAFTTKLTDQAINQGSTLTFTYVAVDPDAGNTVTYTLVNAPTGAALTSAGVLSYTPPVASARTNLIIVVASDGFLTDTAKATITVNHKPVYSTRTPLNLTTVSQNINQVFTVSAKDVDGGALQYSWRVNGALVKGPSTDSTYTAKFTDAHGTAKTVVASYKTAAGLSDSTTWTFTITDVPDNGAGVPTEFALGQNYPNPFNPSTTIRFDLPKEAPVTLEIYNVLGIRIRTLLKGESVSAGHHLAVWDGRDDNGNAAPSGVYLYRINANDFHGSKKMTLVK
jgi:hypothetical protein